MKKLIFIDACMRAGSRTQRIATPIIEELSKRYNVETVDLTKNLYPVANNYTLTSRLCHISGAGATSLSSLHKTWTTVRRKRSRKGFPRLSRKDLKSARSSDMETLFKEKHMSTVRMVILDFDGTLADTAAVIIRTMQATISEMGLPCRTDKQCAAMIGLRLVEIPSALFPECSIDGDMYARTYRRLFHEFNTEDAVKIYPNVIETLKVLKSQGIILTIASSRSHASLAEYVESRGLSSLISYILGADDVNKGKPDPEPVNRTLQRFGINPEEAIVVGDTSFDIQMGKNAGTHTCGVSYGNGSMESLSDADWLIDDFGKLLDIVSE